MDGPGDPREERYVALRFRRSVLRDTEKLWDYGFGGKFACFVRDSRVPPDELEVCGGKHQNKGKVVAKAWRKLANMPKAH